MTPLSKEELRKQIATDKELETVIQLMRQACVSAYEDGQSQKTAARLQLDEDYIRSRLLAWRAAYSKQREVEANDRAIKYIRSGKVAGSFSEGCDCEKCDAYERKVRKDFAAPQPLSPEQKERP